MITSIEIYEKIKALKPFLSDELSDKEIGLFGSYSDNSYSYESDIDILVEFEQPIGWKFLSLEIYLEKIFGKKIDLITKEALKESIRDSILQQVRYI